MPRNGVFKVKNINLSGPCKATKIHIKLQGQIVAPKRDEWEKSVKVEDRSSLILISKQVVPLVLDGVTVTAEGLLLRPMLPLPTAASLHDNTRTSATHDGDISQRDSGNGGRQMTVEGSHGSDRSHWGVGMA
ncbi:hypothetical protein DEO72_LG2g2577 [Vigna unguiculata]|uniref:Uncharacterized protein n=1 Tax=Vigna unguiculata TaxID=3917 RepID=A0A4D6L177_VIGUN|nr:hypothetical protein DEO72_LG2g2577 [Vigna unguiculata]